MDARRLEDLKSAPQVVIAAKAPISQDELDLIAHIASLGPSYLAALADWAQESTVFPTDQVNTARAVAKALIIKQNPSLRQAVKLNKMITDASGMGFYYQAGK